ncbi:MAG: TIM barrel protein [Hyphomicrobiaceae bacterium]
MAHTSQRFATRLNSFRTGRMAGTSVADAIRQVAKVEGIGAVELNYPQHFGGGTAEVVDLAKAAGLAVTALNLRYDGPDYALGAFTHPEASRREAAIELTLGAVDTARRHGIDHVILWMGPDGFDQPFQADYRQLWDWEIDGFRRVARHDPSIRVSVEAKPSDPRRVSIIRSVSDSLLAARVVGLANFGVTLDWCHVLMAGEHPAAAAALALKEGRLFGVHLNDGYGPADDGLPAGTLHLLPLLELLSVLRRGGFAGTIYFDTFPDRSDPAAECAANVRMVKRLQRVLDRIPEDKLQTLQAAQDAIGAMRVVNDALLGSFDD